MPLSLALVYKTHTVLTGVSGAISMLNPPRRRISRCAGAPLPCSYAANARAHKEKFFAVNGAVDSTARGCSTKMRKISPLVAHMPL